MLSAICVEPFQPGIRVDENETRLLLVCDLQRTCIPIKDNRFAANIALPQRQLRRVGRLPMFRSAQCKRLYFRVRPIKSGDLSVHTHHPGSDSRES